MKYDELLSKIKNGEEANIDLPFEDAMTLSQILLKRGYAVLFSSGDFDDLVKVSWVYAGDVDDLEYADKDNILFSSVDYLDMLIYNNYEDDDINPYINGKDE